MSEALRQQVLRYLRDHNAMTLATHGPDGPWAAGLFYVNDGFHLYWLSDPQARHSRNIAQNPRVAVTVHEDYTDWTAIQGIQAEGIAEEIGPPEEATGPMRLYTEKYPFLQGSPTVPPSLAAALAAVRVYRFTPSRLYFIDNAKGLGHREEVALDA